MLVFILGGIVTRRRCRAFQSFQSNLQQEFPVYSVWFVRSRYRCGFVISFSLKVYWISTGWNYLALDDMVFSWVWWILVEERFFMRFECLNIIKYIKSLDNCIRIRKTGDIYSSPGNICFNNNEAFLNVFASEKKVQNMHKL